MHAVLTDRSKKGRSDFFTRIQPGDILSYDKGFLSITRPSSNTQLTLASSDLCFVGNVERNHMLVCFVADIVSACTGLKYEISEPHKPVTAVKFY